MKYFYWFLFVITISILGMYLADIHKNSQAEWAKNACAVMESKGRFCN